MQKGALILIYITGDTHIPTDIQKLNTKRFPEQKGLCEKDFVIICGDFGGVWDNSKEEYYWRKWLSDKSFTTLFVDGNHENFDLLNDFPVVDFFGAKAHKISNKIFHLMRGQIYEIDGNKIFTFGGASSHDKEHRKEGKNWWKEELPSDEEFRQAIEMLEHHNWAVDYVITHCAPTDIQNQIASAYEENSLTDFLENIKNQLKYKKWFFGHYHQDKSIDEKHIALFDKITRL